MKLQSKSDEIWTLGVNFGIVRLGPAAGKLKYTLLDKQDIGLVREFQFEAFVEIDRNGDGACVYAFAYDAAQGRHFGKYVHNLLWERHFGGIAPGFKVYHKNGITMDNRLDNLVLCPVGTKKILNFDLKNTEDSVYWSAIVGMPHEVVPIHVKLFSVQEETSYSDSERFFECHYPPCSRIEQKPQEFSICSLCHVTRYCGSTCQTRDWPWHKSICSQRPRPVVRERYPDR